MAIRQVKQVKARATELDDSALNKHIADYDRAYKVYREGRAAAGSDWGKKKPKKEATVPAPKAKAAKKINVSYRVGKGPMKQGTGIVGKKPGTIKATVVGKTKMPTRARARKSAPVKNAKTAPQKITHYDVKTGRTGPGAEVYEQLGSALGIPRYGAAAPTPGKTHLKRNVKKGARGAHMLY